MDQTTALLLALSVLILWQLINMSVFGVALVAGALISADKKIVVYLLLVFLSTVGIAIWAMVEILTLWGG